MILKKTFLMMLCTLFFFSPAHAFRWFRKKKKNETPVVQEQEKSSAAHLAHDAQSIAAQASHDEAEPASDSVQQQAAAAREAAEHARSDAQSLLASQDISAQQSNLGIDKADALDLVTQAVEAINTHKAPNAYAKHYDYWRMQDIWAEIKLIEHDESYEALSQKYFDKCMSHLTSIARSRNINLDDLKPEYKQYSKLKNGYPTYTQTLFKQSEEYQELANELKQRVKTGELDATLAGGYESSQEEEIHFEKEASTETDSASEHGKDAYTNSDNEQEYHSFASASSEEAAVEEEAIEPDRIQEAPDHRIHPAPAVIQPTAQKPIKQSLISRLLKHKLTIGAAGCTAAAMAYAGYRLYYWYYDSEQADENISESVETPSAA